MKRSPLAAAALLVAPALLVAHGGDAHRHAPHRQGPAPHHGGAVLTEGDHALEVVFLDAGLHVFPMTARGERVTRAGLEGEVVLRARRGAPVTVPLHPMRTPEGEVDHLMSHEDLSGVRDGTRKALFRIRGLGETDVAFSTVLRRTPGATLDGVHGHDAGSRAGPGAGSDHSMAGSHGAHEPASPRSRGKAAHEAAAMAAQRARYPIDWCLVSGDPLGSDGPPVEFLHEGRLIRVCCEGCIRGFRKDPDRYLAILERAGRGHDVSRPGGSHSAGSTHAH